jgi:PTS system cellobiose-specific IIB component
MKTIILLCSAGMSTSLLVSRMQKIALEQGYDYTIEALATNKADDAAKIADVILLGPQVRYELESLKKRLSIPVEAINMRDYGTMNGLNVLTQARKILGDE